MNDKLKTEESDQVEEKVVSTDDGATKFFLPTTGEVIEAPSPDEAVAKSQKKKKG